MPTYRDEIQDRALRAYTLVMSPPRSGEIRRILLVAMMLFGCRGFGQQTESVSAPVQVQASDNLQPLTQPKRILGIIPNYRAVSAGKIPPPPTPREAFKVATQNNFDYSAFLFGGVSTLIAEGTNAHRQLGKGVSGFGRYYWRGFASRTDGNYLVLFALPTVFHQDERYYANGEGRVWKRGIYAASRVLIAPDYHGRNSFNASEIVGRGIAQTVSLTYYSSADQTAGAIAVRYGWALGRDAITNVFREFWPDIAAHLMHRRH
jgi:hypothetical protein